MVPPSKTSTRGNKAQRFRVSSAGTWTRKGVTHRGHGRDRAGEAQEASQRRREGADVCGGYRTHQNPVELFLGGTLHTGEGELFSSQWSTLYFQRAPTENGTGNTFIAGYNHFHSQHLGEPGGWFQGDRCSGHATSSGLVFPPSRAGYVQRSLNKARMQCSSLPRDGPEFASSSWQCSQEEAELSKAQRPPRAWRTSPCSPGPELFT